MKSWITAAAICALATTARAQWTVETHPLQPGWNAIYALNDTSDRSLDTVLAGYPAISKVWRWVPTNLTSQFIANPEAPVAGQEWKTWVRGAPEQSTMTRLEPNHGYLVFVEGAASVTLSLTGRAVVPKVDWRSSGSNLVGFPASLSPAAPQFGGTNSGYFAPLAPLGYNPASTRIFQYIGGEISDTNPSQINAPTSATILRGKAYWVNLPIYADFVSPVKLDLGAASGLAFGTRGGPQKVVLTNTSKAQISVTLTPSESAAPPEGQPEIAGKVPLLQRVWNETAQQFEFVPVTGPLTVTLAAGAHREWTFVPDRSAMTGPAGTRFATVLHVTDAGAHGSYSDLTLPVTAETGGLGGLWVGEAVITQVQNHLQKYQRHADGSNVIDEQGRFVPDGPAQDAAADTAQPFRLRVIVHVDAAGTARLLSNVYIGQLATQPPGPGFTARQAVLVPETLEKAVRITAAHLPLDVVAAMDGSFGAGGRLSATVSVPINDPVNPFLHTYHPDHDNLDARFAGPAAEAFSVARAISLSVDAASPDADPQWGAATLTGTYGESLTGLHKNAIEVAGRFALRRISEITTFVP